MKRKAGSRPRPCCGSRVGALLLPGAASGDADLQPQERHPDREVLHETRLPQRSSTTPEFWRSLRQSFGPLDRDDPDRLAHASCPDRLLGSSEDCHGSGTPDRASSRSIPFVIPPIILVVGLLDFYKGTPRTWFYAQAVRLPRRRVRDPGVPSSYFSLDSGFRDDRRAYAHRGLASIGATWRDDVAARSSSRTSAPPHSAGAFLPLAIVMGEFTIANLDRVPHVPDLHPVHQRDTRRTPPGPCRSSASGSRRGGDACRCLLVGAARPFTGVQIMGGAR